MDMKKIALGILNKNPQLENHPLAKGLREAIITGNDAQGKQIAENICKTYGLSLEEAGKQAKEFFNIK